MGIAAMLTARMTAAQTPRSGGGASAELYQQLQELGSERTSLQAENERLKKELDDMRKERDALKSTQKGLGARAQTAEAQLAQSTTQREALQTQLDRSKAQMQELIAKFRDTITTFRTVEADRNQAKQTLATREHELQACKTRNAALYSLNGDVLTHFERQGVWSCVARTEPFTRIKRTQLENYVDEQRTRADEQRIAPAHGASSPTSAQPPTTVPPRTDEGAAAPVPNAGSSAAH